MKNDELFTHVHENSSNIAVFAKRKFVCMSNDTLAQCCQRFGMPDPSEYNFFLKELFFLKQQLRFTST